MSLFDHDDIAALVSAAIDARLLDKREALLAQLPERIKGALPQHHLPTAQLMSDLEQLNVLEPLPGEPIPLLVWLKNAEFYAGAREESETFAAAIARIECTSSAEVGPTRGAPPPATGFLSGALDLLWSSLFHPARWSAYIAHASRVLPAEFSLSHLSLRLRRQSLVGNHPLHEDPVDRLSDRLLAGACLPSALAIALALALQFVFDRLDISPGKDEVVLRHILCTTALAASAGAGISVGGSVATGMAASTAGIVVGVVGVILDLLSGHRSAHLGIGASGGAALGAAAVVSLAVGRRPQALLRLRQRAATAIPVAVSIALVAMLCVLGFAVSQLEPLQGWYKDREAGALFVVGAVAGATLGAVISVKGWIRVRVLPSFEDRPSPLLTWLGVPLVVGALLTWLSAGLLDDSLPIRGLAIGVLAGAITAAAFSVIYTILVGRRDSMQASAWSAVGVMAAAPLILVGLKVFKKLTDTPSFVIGGLGGFALSASMIVMVRRLTARQPEGTDRGWRFVR